MIALSFFTRKTRDELEVNLGRANTITAYEKQQAALTSRMARQGKLPKEAEIEEFVTLPTFIP